MNLLALITLTSFLIYVHLGTVVYLKNTESSLNRVFFIFSFLTAYMCFTDFQMRMAGSYEVALFWQRAGVLWHLILSALLHFVLVFVHPFEKKRFKLLYIPFYLIGFTFAILDFCGGQVVDGPKSSPWGWSYGVPHSTIIGNLFVIWCTSLIITGIILCLVYYLKVTDPREKQQAKYVLIGTSIPMAAGIFEFVFSWLAMEVPNLLEISFAIGSAFWAYAIWKYELFVLSPVTTVKEIIQTMTDVLFVIDPALKIKIVNQATLDLFGFKRHELLDQPVEILFDAPDYRRIENSSIPTELRKNGHVNDTEISVRSKAGREISLSLAGTLVRDKKGQFQGIAFIGRDITKRKLEEQELRRYQEHLKDIVTERTAELEKTYAQLQHVQKMEFMGTIAGGVAHDLNNILSGIVSYPELLLLELPPESPLRKPLMTIQQSGEKAATIVSDLLTLARREISVKKVVNLNRIVEEYFQSPESLKLMSNQPDARISTQLDPNLMNLIGSPVHISKSLMNLVHNGIEAMLSGGELVIYTENRQIHEPINGYEQIETGSYVVLCVSDTGTGIDPDDMERIFEPFYTKKAMSQSGSGLGMAVVWGTVKDHDGYVDVKSRKGKGTAFSLYFPATEQPEDSTPDALPMERIMGKGETVIVVDDVAEQREIACGILKKIGYEPHAVSSGEAAVAYLQMSTVDLLLLDMIMHSGMDGLDTYKQIRAFRPAQKVVIASGYSENERVKEAKALGVNTFIHKPYSLETIGLALRTELDGFKS